MDCISTEIQVLYLYDTPLNETQPDMNDKNMIFIVLHSCISGGPLQLKEC